MHCLTPLCRSSAMRRGNCFACYQGNLRAIAAGLDTWESLIAKGLALPPADRREQLRQELRRRGTGRME